MSSIPLSLVRFAGLKKHQSVFYREVQKRGDVHFSGGGGDDSVFQESVVDAARLQFFLDFASKDAPKGLMEGGVLTGGKIVLTEEELRSRADRFAAQADSLIARAEWAEDVLVRAKNEKEQLELRRLQVLPYVGVGSGVVSSSVRSWVGVVPSFDFDAFRESIELVSPLVDVRQVGASAVCVIAHVDVVVEVQSALSQSVFVLRDASVFRGFEGVLPADVVAQLDTQIAEQDALLVEAGGVREQMRSHVNDARVYADVIGWDVQCAKEAEKSEQTDSLFVVEAWIPAVSVGGVKRWLADAFVGEVSLDVIKDAVTAGPALLRNWSGFRPFEMLTNMYGAPTRQDIDPTPFLSPWFVLFFGICLSDVGYGSLLVLVSSVFLLLGTFDRDMKDTLRLILFCGISAVIGGVLLGGWFGMTPAQAPGFLTTTADGVALFKGQILNATEGSGPLQFLIFSVYVGIAQLLSGVVVEFYKHIKKGDVVAAFADSAAWFFFLVSLVGFALATAEVLPLPVETMKVATLVMAGVLVLTQGRHEKNWVMKPLMGLLGLYGVMNYLSDILSYSRLMALGLATGVIANAMNTTAGVLYEMVGVPGLAHLVALVVLVFGHGLNFALSMLGASIHSMRLQFIEFFGRFYTGGAETFAPLVRRAQHIFIRS